MSLDTRSRLILHVGLPKTGTSSVQSVFRKHRERLGSAGICFPEHYDSRGNDVVHGVAALALASGVRKQRERGEGFFRKAVDAMESHHTVLVSSEDLSKYCSVDDGAPALEGFRAMQMDYHHGTSLYWERRHDYLRRLADAIGDAPTEVWITLRRQDSLCTSIYKQAVLNRRYVGTPSDLARSDFPLFDFYRLTGAWAQHFPVRVFVYEDSAASDGGVAEPYFDALGISSIVSPNTVARTNQAVHPDMIEACRRLNYFPIDKGEVWKRLRQWGRHDPLVRAGGKFDLLANREREEILGRYADGNEHVRQRFGVETPGRASLFPEIGETGRELYPGMEQERFESICLALELEQGIIR